MDKKKGKSLRQKIIRIVLIVLLSIALIVAIPWLLDRFFANELYMKVFRRTLSKRESPMTVGEWFGFLGSYLGVIGTIIIGIVAYRQAYIINKQNESYSNLQEQIARMQQEIDQFRIHPIIVVKKSLLEVVDGSKNILTTRKKLEDYYFSVYGAQNTNGSVQYIMIKILFEDKGIMPTVQCEIRGLEWEIAGNKYIIEMNESKRKIDLYDTIDILIDDNDNISDKETFYRDLDWHEHYCSSLKVGYDKSILRLKICFVNQKGYTNNCDLIYRINCEEQGLNLGIPFVKSGSEVEDNERG